MGDKKNVRLIIASKLGDLEEVQTLIQEGMVNLNFEVLFLFKPNLLIYIYFILLLISLQIFILVTLE